MGWDMEDDFKFPALGYRCIGGYDGQKENEGGLKGKQVRSFGRSMIGDCNPELCHELVSQTYISTQDP